ncbi:MAG TPA: amidohydrolase family protein [Thermomicrobiales bacterium]|nr:amidohydrolase family protein [Thermomicrobiales bacterium]
MSDLPTVVRERDPQIPPRVFDTHVHFPWGTGRHPSAVSDELVELAKKLNIVHMALLGSRREDYNDRVSQAIEHYPDLFIGMYGVELGEDTPEVIQDAHDRGFRGLKIIHALKPYDDRSYWSVFEKAEELGIVTLFHTGVVGGGVDFRDTDPFSPEVVKRSPFFEKRLRGQGFSSRHMDPILLDTLAFTFPRLRIIGAHMGVGQYDYACHIARWRRNVFWDISGGELVRRHVFERRLIGQEISPMKILFASDCGMEKMGNEIADWAAVFDQMRLTIEERDRIFYGNAARLFALDEFAGVTNESCYDEIWNSYQLEDTGEISPADDA